MKEPMYIRQAETESIMGDRIILYYFTRETVEEVDGEERVMYGIGIDMYTQLHDERTIRERKIVEGVFKNKTDAEKFIDLICKGYVTPATLEDIISDNVENAAC